MVTFVINLDERTDRWENIQQTFNFFNLQRIEAVKYTPGWFGCLQSHIKCLHEAKN